MCYAHLTHKERYQIELLIQQGLSVSRIARMLHVHRSTIYREISRSGCKGNYRADHAQNSAERRIRRSADNHRCKPAGLWRLVRRYLRQDWSPEQIRGRLKYWRQVWVSVPAIYAHIRREREQGGHLYQHLRHAKRKRRWGAGHGGLTKDRPSIHQRPKRVKSRRQLGHWEGDTFIGTKIGRAHV